MDKNNDIIKYWPVRFCFCEEGLYNTDFFNYSQDLFENEFFGPIDRKGAEATDQLIRSTFINVNLNVHYTAFINYMGSQYLRTPKGMYKLKKALELTGLPITNNKIRQNTILDMIRKLTGFYGAIWSESVWEIVSSIDSNSKFIISDTPVTIYNNFSFPGSKECITPNDPEIQWIGTQTIFPLSMEYCLILTNKEYYKNRKTNLKKSRTNPGYFREALFSALDIIRKRSLDDLSVIKINYILKMRSYKYIASNNKSDLYPEIKLKDKNWKKLGKTLLINENLENMMGTSIVKYKNGNIRGFDYLGRNTPDSTTRYNEMQKILLEALMNK